MRRWKHAGPRSARCAPMMTNHSKVEENKPQLYRCSSTAALTTPTRPAVQGCSRLRTRPHQRPGPEMRRRIRVAASIRRRRSTSPATRYHRSPRRALRPRCPLQLLHSRGTRLCRARMLRRHTRYARRRPAAKSWPLIFPVLTLV